MERKAPWSHANAVQERPGARGMIVPKGTLAASKSAAQIEMTSANHIT
jgi:hypothetical protein